MHIYKSGRSSNAGLNQGMNASLVVQRVVLNKLTLDSFEKRIQFLAQAFCWMVILTAFAQNLPTFAEETHAIVPMTQQPSIILMASSGLYTYIYIYIHIIYIYYMRSLCGFPDPVLTKPISPSMPIYSSAWCSPWRMHAGLDLCGVLRRSWGSVAHDESR